MDKKQVEILDEIEKCVDSATRNPLRPKSVKASLREYFISKISERDAEIERKARIDELDRFSQELEVSNRSQNPAGPFEYTERRKKYLQSQSEKAKGNDTATGATALRGSDTSEAEKSAKSSDASETYKNYKLCYVKNHVAYFTLLPLSQQCGDDWDDAPYEHNAGYPYDDKGPILEIPFSGEFKEPRDGHINSPYSVESINRKEAPWLVNGKRKLYAGASPKEFFDFIGKKAEDSAEALKSSTAVGKESNRSVKVGEDAPSMCCRQSLSCGGAILEIADGGKGICINCIDRLPKPINWTPALLAEACEKLAEDKEICSGISNNAGLEADDEYNQPEYRIRDCLKSEAMRLRKRVKKE